MAKTLIFFDLEWNNVPNIPFPACQNEIYEIGAVKCNSSLEVVDTIRILVKPKIYKKLCSRVKKMSGITDEELAYGITFNQAIKQLQEWAGNTDNVWCSWASEDIRQLKRNYFYFCKKHELDWMTYYLDVQSYFTHTSTIKSIKNQPSLDHACQLLSIKYDEAVLHTALADAKLAYFIFKSLYKEETLDSYIFHTSKIRLKTTYINSLSNDSINKRKMQTKCPVCGKFTSKTSKWKFSNSEKSFVCYSRCQACDIKLRHRIAVRMDTFSRISYKNSVSICNDKKNTKKIEKI